jgi:hypothetical protein
MGKASQTRVGEQKGRQVNVSLFPFSIQSSVLNKLEKKYLRGGNGFFGCNGSLFIRPL